MTLHTGTTPHGLTTTALSTEQTSHLIRTVLTSTPQPPDPTTAADQWCIAELTDGRITGIHTPTGWWLSIDEHSDLGPARLGSDASDWWRLRTLRVFDPVQEAIIAADHTAPIGTLLTDNTTPTSIATRPRDRSLLISSGTTTNPTPRTPTSQPQPQPGTQLGDRFAVLTTTSYRTSVIPGPLTASHGIWHTRLHIREYFAQDPDTGMVGVAATRYLALAPTLDRP